MTLTVADLSRRGALLGSLVVAISGPPRGAAALQANSPGAHTGAHPVVQVSPTGAVRSIQAALRVVDRGGTIIVQPGTYADTTIVVGIPVTILGRGWPVLDGGNARQIMSITADSVTVRGIRFRNVGVAFTRDLAAITVVRAHDCVIADNRVENGFFGIYLQEAQRCRVEGNVLHASHARDSESGNGIHLWHSRDITIQRNRISGHRDGIYFEFVREAHVRDNVSEKNLRYGLHFMYSDSCDYTANRFRANGAGVAVMYSHRVDMTRNRFENNRGSAAYGLLLKEIADARLERNVFSHNATGLFADGASRLVAIHNTFLDNGWALKLEASTDAATFTANNFAGNTFDVATNSRASAVVFRGNYWSAYDGYDLDGNGTGDVPFRPVRLASVIVAQNEPALILLRSNFMVLLDAAERVLPALTPEGLTDSAPSMRWNQ